MAYCIAVMIHQPVAYSGPRASSNRFARGHPHGFALCIVPDKIANFVAQICGVPWLIQPPGLARRDQIDGTPRARCHDRNSTGEPLLNALTERLVFAGVHKQVKTRQCLGEIRASKESEEVRSRKQSLEFLARRTITDDEMSGLVGLLFNAMFHSSDYNVKAAARAARGLRCRC